MAKYKKVNDHADMIVKAFVNCNKRNLENRDLISLIEENNIDCMETMIRDSVKYPRIYETNLAVSESLESPPGIRNEFRLFMKEIMEMINTFEN